MDLDKIQWNGHMNVAAVATSGPIPSATLKANHDELELAGTLGHFRIPRSQVQRVQRAGFYPWLWGGIRIRHEKPNYPRLIQFCPAGTRSRRIVAALKAMGYPAV